jgi:hypothetical protein
MGDGRIHLLGENAAHFVPHKGNVWKGPCPMRDSNQYMISPGSSASRIGKGKRARMQWANLPTWTMLFATAIGGRLHDKAQADTQSSPKTAGP